MERVTGIGGIFFTARDPQSLGAWYKKHLGIDVQSWGGTTFRWNDPQPPGAEGTTVWSLFPLATPYFAPSSAPFMVNYRVADLDGLLAALRAEGCDVDEKTESSDFGKFGWVMDPEGHRIELWQPPVGHLRG